MDRIDSDNVGYFKFTGPQRLDKAVHTLQGLLTGIAADRSANEQEVGLLRSWLSEHESLHHRHPFNEIVPGLREAMADGQFDPEELADLIWLCSRMRTDNAYFDAVCSDMQRLQGVMGGIAADGVITMEELESLARWMQEHEHLRTCWPYDEVESLLLGIRADGRIDPREHEVLVSFFSEFTTDGSHRAVGLPLNEVNVPVTGLCAVCPEVVFADRLFCFTGRSVKMTRNRLAEIVRQHGGEFSPRLTQQVDYLVIGADGNPCWAYACYGRKVEEAIRLRKQGSRMLLVHEHDFWDSVRDRSTKGL